MSATVKIAAALAMSVIVAFADDEVPDKSIKEVSASISGASIAPFVEVPDFVPTIVDDSLVPGSLGYFEETNSIALPVGFRFWRKHPDWSPTAKWTYVTNDLPQPTWVQTNRPAWFVSKSKYGWMLDPSGCSAEGTYHWFEDEDWDLAHYYPGRVDYVYYVGGNISYKAVATDYRYYQLTNSICYPRAMLMTPPLYAALLSTYNAYFSRLYYGSESSEYDDWDMSIFGPVEPCPEFRWNAMGGETHFEMTYPSTATVATCHMLFEGENKMSICRHSDEFMSYVVSDSSDATPGFVYRPGWMTSMGQVNNMANSQQIWWAPSVLPPLVEQINEELRYTPDEDSFGLFPNFGWTEDPVGTVDMAGRIYPSQQWECYAMTMQNLIGGGLNPCAKLFADVGYAGDCPLGVVKGYSSGFTNLVDFLAWKFPVSATKYSNRPMALKAYRDDVWYGARSKKLEPWGYVFANQAISLPSKIIHIPSIALTTWNRHVDVSATQRYVSSFDHEEDATLTLKRGEDGYWHASTTHFEFKLVKGGGTQYEEVESYAGESDTIDLIVNGCEIRGYDQESRRAGFDMPSFSFMSPINLEEEGISEFFDRFCHSDTFLLERVSIGPSGMRLSGNAGFTLGPPAEFGTTVEGVVPYDPGTADITLDMVETGVGFNMNLHADYDYTVMASNRLDVGKLYPGKKALRDDAVGLCEMVQLKKRFLATDRGIVDQYAASHENYDRSAPAASIRTVPDKDLRAELKECTGTLGGDPLSPSSFCRFTDFFNASIDYLPKFSARIVGSEVLSYPIEGESMFEKIQYYGTVECPFVIVYTAGVINVSNTYTGSCDIVKTTTRFPDGFVTTTATTNLFGTAYKSSEETMRDLRGQTVVVHYDPLPYSGERWPSQFPGATVYAHETTNRISYITYMQYKNVIYSGPELDIDITYTDNTHAITNESTSRVSFDRSEGFSYDQVDIDVTNVYAKVMTVIPQHQTSYWKQYACLVYYLFTRYYQTVSAVKIARPYGEPGIPPTEFHPYDYAEYPIPLGRRGVYLGLEGKASGLVNGDPGPCTGEFESHVKFKTMIGVNFSFPTMAGDPETQGHAQPDDEKGE